MTKEETKAAVERGAMMLDRYVPDWYKKVNEAMIGGTFIMSDYEYCIAGVTEVWHREDSGTQVLAFNGVVFSPASDSHWLGFDADYQGPESPTLEDLQVLWEIEVSKRLELDLFIEKNDKSKIFRPEA